MKLFFLSLIAAVLGRRTVIACNIAPATSPAGRKTFFAEKVIPESYLISTRGTTSTTVTLCDAAAKPMGILADEADNVGDPIVNHLLGAVPGTQLVRAGAAIQAGDQLGSDANAKAVPVASGGWCIGEALTSAAAGELVEIIPAYPFKAA